MAEMELKAGQLAGAREHWISQGYDPAAFDQAVTIPAEPSGAPTEAPDGREEIEVLGASKAPSLTGEQALEMAQALRNAGVSEDLINQALAADGLSNASDTRTEDQVEYDRAFATAAPADYHVNYMGLFPPDTDISVIAAYHRENTQWAHDLGLPADLGASMIERGLELGQRYERMSAPERALWIQEQKVTFERLAGGPEKAAERMALAGKALAKGDPRVAEALHKSGALHDAFMVLNLANQAERAAAR